jgi:hypothetical protein
VGGGLAFAERQLEREEGGGEDAGDGDRLALEFGQFHRVGGNDHGAVLVSHGRPAAHQRVLVGDVRIGVDRDGRDFELALATARVERLDVLEDVLEPVGALGDEVLGHPVEHEGIVGVRGVAKAEELG